MENSSSKGSGGAADKPTADRPDPNPNPSPPTNAGSDDAMAAAAEAASRRPFASLSQEDRDLALARVLQEQERAYMMLQMNGGGGGSEYGSSDAGSYEYEEEEEEEGDEDYEEELQRHLRVHPGEPPAGEGEAAEGSEFGEEALEEDEEVEDAEPEVDPAEYDDDEAYARALQEAEEREVAARLMALAGLSEWRPMEQEEEEEHENDPQDAWQEVDPDEYSYEELVALGEVVGTESRGLSADTLASLPSVTYKAQDMQDGNMEQCVICRVEFEEGESLVALPCKHSYHPECINQWLQINKVCPMCSAEVSTSASKQA